jgi:uncharacterized protein (TIGR03083 family)
MSQMGVDGFRAERAAILDLAGTLTDDEWNAPSDCAGWAVRDVLAHMASVLHGVVEPSAMPDLSGGTEAGMEAPVAERRKLPVADVVAEYETYSEQAANTFAMFQEPPLSQNELPMGELGTHPMSMLASTFLFDAYCHLRNDILGPNGPIDRPEPPRDEQRLRPTVEWMIAGLPWMCVDALAVVDRPLTLRLKGPGGGTFTLQPGRGERIEITDDTGDAAAAAAATVKSGDHDFVVWGTKRRPWQSFVVIEGDEGYAAKVLDAFKVI